MKDVAERIGKYLIAYKVPSGRYFVTSCAYRVLTLFVDVTRTFKAHGIMSESRLGVLTYASLLNLDVLYFFLYATETTKLGERGQRTHLQIPGMVTFANMKIYLVYHKKLCLCLQ